MRNLFYGTEIIRRNKYQSQHEKFFPLSNHCLNQFNDPFVLSGYHPLHERAFIAAFQQILLRSLDALFPLFYQKK